MSEEQHRKILELFRERTQLQREIRQRLESVQEITRRIAALDKGRVINGSHVAPKHVAEPENSRH